MSPGFYADLLLLSLYMSHVPRLLGAGCWALYRMWSLHTLASLLAWTEGGVIQNCIDCTRMSSTIIQYSSSPDYHSLLIIVLL